MADIVIFRRTVSAAEKGVIAIFTKLKKLTAIIMALAVMRAQVSVFASGDDAFYAQDDILMKVGCNHAFYKRNEVPIDVINDNATPYKDDNGAFYIPLEFIAHCMREKLIADADAPGKYIINKNNITADMKDSIPYITAQKAEELTGKTLLINGDCIILSADSGSAGYEKIFDKLKNDFENTYRITPDESKGKVLADVSGSLWGASSGNNKYDIGDYDVGFENFDGIENRFVYKLTTKKATSNPNDLNFRFFNSSGVDVKIRDVGFITFYARRSKGSPGGKIAVTLQDDSYNTVFSQELVLGDEWKKYELTFKSNKNISKDNRRLFIALGYEQQTIELSEFKAVVFPDTVYAEYNLPQTKLNYVGFESEDESQWLRDALLKINAGRKKCAQVSVYDDLGNPIDDADIEITMDDHLFNLGTEVSQFYITNPGWSTTKAWDVLPEEENIKLFNSTLKEYFNTAVPGNAYKWASWRGRVSDSDKCAELIKDMGLRMRGHVLWWDLYGFYSNDADERQAFLSMSRDEQNRVVNDHITSMLTRYKDKAAEWDVLNEPCQSRGVLLANTAYGKETVIKDWFNSARKAEPNAVLYVNEKDIVGKDNDNLNKLKTIVTGMINNGVDFDAVGVQGHMGSMPQSPQKVAKEIEEITALGKKVSITEYDMSTRNDWLQAQYLKKMLINSYANPNVLGFTMWGHWDVDHEKRTSAMFRDDWTEKPGAYIWKGLFDYSFSSNIKCRTNGAGKISADLYEGIYNINITKNGLSQSTKLTVDKSGEYTVKFDMSSLRFLKNVRLISGGSEIKSLSEWDGSSPLSIDFTINKDYFDDLKRNIYVAQFNSGGKLLGVKQITADRTDGNIKLSLQRDDAAEKIKVFVWDNKMIPANLVTEY